MFSIITNDRIFLYLTYQTCIRIKIILRKIHRQLNIVQEKAWISKNVWNFKKWLTWRCKSKLSFSLSLSVSSFLSPISESRIHPKKIQTKYPPFILACNVLFFFTSILLHIKFYISMKNSSIQFYFHPLFKYNFIFLVVFFVFFSRFNWIFRFSFFFHSLFFHLLHFYSGFSILDFTFTKHYHHHHHHFFTSILNFCFVLKRRKKNSILNVGFCWHKPHIHRYQWTI